MEMLLSAILHHIQDDGEVSLVNSSKYRKCAPDTLSFLINVSFLHCARAQQLIKHSPGACLDQTSRGTDLRLFVGTS